MKENDNKKKVFTKCKVLLKKIFTHLQTLGKAGHEKMIKGTCNQCKD